MAGPAVRGRGSCGKKQTASGSGRVVRRSGDFFDDGQSGGNAGAGVDKWFAAAGTHIRGSILISERRRTRQEVEGKLVGIFGTRRQKREADVGNDPDKSDHRTYCS